MESDSPHFVVRRAAQPGPVVVEIPHAGLEIDAAASRFTRIPADVLAAGAVVADSDIAADLVWEGAEARGVTTIIARASRYVIDLNTEPRLPTPYEEKMPAPLRTVVHHSHCGVTWRASPLPKAEIERRVREVFEPYHACVAEELARSRGAHGTATLVSSHSFPAHRTTGPEATADVVLGTRHGASASEASREAAAVAIRDHGFSVAYEVPFAGGYAAARHGRPTEGISVVQIEIARRILVKGGDDPFAPDPDAIARVGRMLVDLTDALARHMSSSRR